MSRFIETIRIENGIPLNLDYHLRRFHETKKSFYGSPKDSELEDYLSGITGLTKQKTYRCTLYYSKKIESHRIVEYSIPRIRSLRVIEGSHLVYSFKYADRSGLEQLYEQRKDCDDIIIVKHGLVTDSYFANLIFFDGHDWYTPSVPLLRGTKRESLISTGVLRKRDIRPSDIPEYEYLSLINAMLDPGQVSVNIHNIY